MASLFAILAVALGAFGAHGLKKSIEINQLATFEIGVRYQFYHSLGIFLVAILCKEFESKWLIRAAWLFVMGIILFSGSLYLLACRELLQIEHWKWLGPLTPIGGTFFIIGWLFVLISTLKTESKQ